MVLHYTAMADAAAALDRLCDPVAEVSAHYLICRSGAVWQMVDEEMRAWHAGAGSWRGRGDVNSRSIGIELDNDGQAPFAEPQMAALEALLPGLLERWSIPAAGVIGHSDMAPGRKADPGRRFDWHRLARQSLAAPSVSGAEDAPDAARFRALLAEAGYLGDAADDVLLEVFRARHAPVACGPLSPRDMALASGAAGQGDN